MFRITRARAKLMDMIKVWEKYYTFGGVLENRKYAALPVLDIYKSRQEWPHKKICFSVGHRLYRMALSGEQKEEAASPVFTALGDPVTHSLSSGHSRYQD